MPTKEWVSFYVIGDFGTIAPFESSHQVFSAIDQIVGNAATPDKPDFFISLGDNVAPGQPIDSEKFTFDNKRGYMSSPNLQNMPVYVTRGNLDAVTIHWSDMVEASMSQEQFIYPSLYYSKVERMGALNSRVAFMFIDATLFLCSTDSTPESAAYEAFKAEKCTDPNWTAWGDTQNKWIKQTLALWDTDGSIMYRVLVNHFPMWSSTTNSRPDDFSDLNKDLLPLLRSESFVLYLASHSVTSFANIKAEETLDAKEQPDFESTIQGTETWFKYTNQDRFKGFDQGQAFH